MSSLKMTFSLTSLIFLIALGLVFAPTAVMAHDASQTGTPASVGPHTHPVKVAVDADSDATPPVLAVPIHRAHPTATISLKAGDTVMGTEVIVTADDAATTDVSENVVTLVVQFDRPTVIGGDGTATATATDLTTALLTATNFTFSIRDAKGTLITNTFAGGTVDLTLGTVVRSEPTGGSMFLVPLTIPAEAIPTGTADAADEKFELKIRVNRGAGYSLRKSLTSDDGLTDIPVDGGESQQSMVKTFTLVSELPTAPDTTKPTVTITAPKAAETNGDLVFTFAFSEELGNASNDLQAGDIDVMGGTVASVDQDTTDAKKYAVTVTPTDTPPDVAISLRADSVADAAGNFIDLTGTNDGKSTYDKVHPTVVSHTSAVPTTTPTGHTGDFLDFTFTFSEPIDKSTITVSAVDQGSSHNAHFNVSYFFDAADTTGDATNSYTITVKVLDPQKVTTIALKIGANSVEDMAENGLAESYTASATHTPPANKSPIFVDETLEPIPDDKQAASWCEEQNRGNVRLPKATDSEGQSLVYSLSPNERGHSLPENPNPAPASGLYWVTIDTETRYIQGTAEYADRGTYTWTVTDPHGATDTMQITIIVKQHQPPKPVKSLVASKVNSASESAPTENRVILGFDVPEDLTDWPDCIPPVTSYTVHIDVYNEVLGMFEDYGTDTEYQLTDTSRFTVDSTGKIYSLALDELPKGIYKFKITPHNKSTLTHPTSGFAMWNTTRGTHVVVADVPAAPRDLRAAVADGVYATVNWVKVPDYREGNYPYNTTDDDGGAPIYDDKVAATHADYQDQMDKRNMYYGPGVDGDFAGYILYQVNQTTNVETKYALLTEASATADKASYITNYDHPTTRVGPLTEGEYVFRVTAVNVAGESPRSESTPYAHIRIVTSAAPVPPVGGLPTAKVVPAEYNPATGTTSFPSAGSLAPNDFAVINANALPDIQRFFAEGGTLSVLNTSGTSKDIVISEIMWGLNLAKAIGAGRKEEQFIELYNTTATAIPLSTVTIVFDASVTVPTVPTGKVLLDQISNIVGGWVITDAPGQDGSIVAGGASLYSMYRTIKYDDVVKTHNASDAADNRKKQLDSIKDGNALASWAKSNVADTYGVNRIGSPGARHFKAFVPLTASTVDRAQVIINEIGNHSDDKYDWIELRNVSSGEVNLKKWELSQVTDDKKDTALVSFPDNDNHKIPAGGILLIVNSDPYRDPDHPIAAGTRINTGNPEGTGTNSRYYVDSSLKLKNSGKTLLILRNANDKEGKPEALKDVVGTLGIADTAATLRTKMWPLAATGAPDGDVVKDADEDLRAGFVYVRNAGGGTGKHHINRVGYTGVGYKRAAAKSNQNGGTPGYDNGAVKVNESELAADATVSISEIMYAKGNNLPQWIELYNSSMTQAVNLSEWKLKIEHHRDADVEEDVSIRVPSVTTNNFGGGIHIQPNQTVLIVSTTTGRVSRAALGGVDFPATRVINLWAQKDKLEVEANVNRREYQLLSETAFKITLMDKSGAAVDSAGNWDPKEGMAMWELPMAEDGRSSIIRRYDDAEPRRGTMAPPGDGTGAWVLASESSMDFAQFETFYGSEDDEGTPGYRGGGALPVSLSKFRPERLDDGSIQIVWITESELNNAGFNILRSEKRDGEFKQINTSLIAGKGTTSERHTYEWKDTSAKPNVVYYYQIQDVSLDGKVQTLRQSRLKGDVSPTGKATTTWGEIKALQ